MRNNTIFYCCLLWMFSTLVMQSVPGRSQESRPFRSTWISDNGNGTFTNPIFYENFCDPDIIRVGDEYYATGTTMHSMPGLPLLHSKDLVNWDLVSYCFSELDLGPAYRMEEGKEIYGRGIWAPCLRHHKGTFYIWTDIPDYGSIVYSATNPRGPWKGTKMNGAFHDASVLFDDDGKTYIAWGAGKIYMAQLDGNMRDTIPGTCQMIFTPDRKMNEGCHLYKIDGRYYLTNIWWKTNPMSLMCARADHPYGPWEINRSICSGETFGLQRGYRLRNPRGKAPYGVLEPDTTDNGNVSFAQGGLVQTTSGEWWGFVHNDYNSIGRPTALSPITWKDGWPYFGLPGNLGRFPRIWVKPDTKLTDVPHARYQCDDDFSDAHLGPQWQWNHVPHAAKWSLTEKPGVLRLHSLPATDFWTARNSLTQNGVGPISQPTVTLDASGLQPGDHAGLALLSRPYGWIGVVAGGDGTLNVMQYDELTGDTARAAFAGQKIWLRAHCDYLSEKAQFSYSLDGKEFSPLGQPFTMFFQTKTFQGVRYTLFNYNSLQREGGYADFDDFRVWQPHPYGLTRPIPYGQQIVLTDRRTGKPIRLGKVETVTVEDCSLGRVALRADEGYWSVDEASGKVAVRVTDQPGRSETFQWIETPYGDLVLLSLATNRYFNVAVDGSFNALARGPKPSRMDGTCLTWQPATAVQPADTVNYLMTYFKDATHSVYFALSRDGRHFADVNHYKPAVYGTKYAEQRGVRDPHIYRAPDGCYYMVLTDLNVAAQQMGFRETRWQRDGKKYGWGNNRAIVMMKSSDLINWTSSVFRLDTAFPETREVGRFWAPQTIWDEEAGRMMVYFTLGMAGKPNALYYSYADRDFTRLTEVPKPFRVEPMGNLGIDQDITEVNGKFRMFYCWKGRIIQAVADKLTGTYRADTTKVDGEPAGSEAPNVWRKGCTDTYWLMYHPYAKKGESDTNFGFSETTDFKDFVYKGRMNEGACPIRSLNFETPNHGTVIQIPASDAKRLAEYWHYDYSQLPVPKKEDERANITGK